MDLKNSSTALFVNDIEVSKHFYLDVLGLTVDLDFGKNVRFLHEIHEESWGQQTIRFFDPDNHLIEIGESMKQFVGRFFNQGLAIDDISKRTGVPVEEVNRLVKGSNSAFKA